MGDILNTATMKIVLQQIDRLYRDDFKILAGGRDPTPLIEKLYAEMALPTVPAKSTIGKIFVILTRRIQEQGVDPYAIFNGSVKWNEEEITSFLSEEITGSPSDYLQILRLRLVRKYPEFNNIIVGGKSKRSKSKSKSKSKKSKKSKSKSKRSKSKTL
jgi:hypothetical protein